MAVAERSVRKVVKHRKDRRQCRQGKRQGMAPEHQQRDTGQRPDGQNNIDQEYGPDQPGVGALEVVVGMLAAEPGGNDPPARQLRKQRRFVLDKGNRQARLLLKVGALPERRIPAGFLIPGDALNAARGVLVKEVVVADPQLEREAGADRNKTMKLAIVADGPGKAAKNYQRQRSQRDSPR